MVFQTGQQNAKLAVALLITALLVPFVHVQARPAWKVAVDPVRPVNGSPMLIRVTPPAQLASLQGSWMDHKFTFRFSPRCGCWYAIAGVALSTKPGQYTMHLEGDSETRHGLAFDYPVLVRAGHYPSTTITVPPQFVEPPKEVLQRIEQEQKIKKKALADTAPEPLWAGRFLPPTNTEETGVFGSARVYNGSKRNQHMGLDFRAPVGTPVHATSAGKVVLARSLYYEGNCVMLDHGNGLITIYMHNSELKVKEGETVQKGQLLALSGGTGRATGPHVHFAVRWQGVYLNPATLLKLNAP